MNKFDDAQTRRAYLWFASALLVVLMGSIYQIAVRHAPALPDQNELRGASSNQP